MEKTDRQTDRQTDDDNDDDDSGKIYVLMPKKRKLKFSSNKLTKSVGILSLTP